MNTICIGDSLTYGYGVHKSKRWSNLLNEKYGIDIVNKGINGDTTSGMLDRFYEDVLSNSPSHVIIMGGTNDLIKYCSLENVIENIKALMDEALKNNITPIVGIQIPFYIHMAKNSWSPTLHYDKIQKDIILYRQWVIEYCRKNNLKYIDFYERFSSIDEENKKDYYIDGLHPNEKGHRLMVFSVLEASIFF